MISENKERITITMAPHLVARIDEACERRGESRSACIERVMAFALDELEDQLRRLESPVTQMFARAIASSPELFAAMAKVAGAGLSKEELSEVQGRLKQDIEWASERKKAKKGKKDAGQG